LFPPGFAGLLMAESSAWMRAELARRRSQQQETTRGTRLFAISTTFALSSSVILCRR
jgi:hypothetical protein